jgi:hypothetical protein
VKWLELVLLVLGLGADLVGIVFDLGFNDIVVVHVHGLAPSLALKLIRTYFVVHTRIIAHYTEMLGKTVKSCYIT